MKKDKRPLQSEGGPGQGALQTPLQTGREQPAFFTLSRGDLIFAPVVAAVAGIVLFFTLYSAINWDDLLYMSLAQYTWKEAWILNRYGHIYLLKFFFTLAGDAITGARIYWCFVFFGTCTLTYWSAKIIAGRKGTLAAVVAVLLISMQPLFGREAGSPLADFTVMFLLSLAVFIYLYFLNNRGKFAYLFVMLLGLIFFWAVKSKENGICIAVLFLGLGRAGDGLFSLRRFAKDVGMVACGAAAGQLLLMMLDAAFVGDFLFSVRPSNIAQLFNTNLGFSYAEPQAAGTLESWFAFFTTSPLLFPFILYLLVGWRSPDKEFSVRERIVWLIPLLLMLFLTFSRRAWYVVPRYFSPAIPVMCIFAAQFFKLDLSDSLRKAGGSAVSRRVAAILLALAALAIVLVFVPQISRMALYYKLDKGFYGFPHLKYEYLTKEELFYMLAVMPVAISGLLITSALAGKRALARIFFLSLFAFGLMMPAYADSGRLVDLAVVKSKWRYEACRVFKGEMRFDKQTKILISKNVFSQTWLMGRDASAHCNMFNIYFNQRLDYNQFIDGDRQDILKGGYSYALLLQPEYTMLAEDAGFKKVLRDYEVKVASVTEPRSEMAVGLVLLKKR